MTVPVCALVVAAALALLLLLAFPGYALLLGVLVRLRGSRTFESSEDFPPLTLVISALNEEDVIGAKIDNARSLDYPALRIVVVSDASEDATDRIVEAAAREDERVSLHRMEKRGGKTVGLNSALESVDAPLVAFTDANAMFEPDALKWLVRPMADPKVGYVVGAATYSDASGTEGARTEGRYWRGELRIKKLESDLSSVVGADGAIYAIRRELYQPLQVQDINDFVNPLQIVERGFRGVFEPRAICHESTTGSVGREIARKRRIVNRSFAGLLRVRGLLNPFRFGLFSMQLWLHKVVRWFSPLIAIAILLALAVASSEYAWLRWPIAAVFGGGFILLALPRFGVTGRGVPFLTEAIYVAGVSLATIQAIIDVARGRVSVTWQTRGTDDAAARLGAPWAARFLTALIAAVPVGAVALALVERSTAASVVALAVTVLGAVGHSFAYALALRIRSVIGPREPAPEGGGSPPVTMVISAHNEEVVLDQKIRNALATEYPGEFRIIVASDGSTDGTNVIAERYAEQGVRLYRNEPRTGKAGMLKRVKEHVETDLVVLSDCNAMYEPSAVAHLVAHFADPRIGAVTGSIDLVDPKIAEDGNSHEDVWLNRSEKLMMSLESDTGGCAAIDGAMVAVRRALIPEYGDGTILDDLVLAMEVSNRGHRVKFEGRARGREESVETLRGEYERRARIMAGIVQLYRRGIGLPHVRSGILMRFLGHKVWRWCAPLYALAALVVLIAWLGLLPALAISLGGVAALYGALGAWRGWGVAARKVGYLFVYQLAAFGGVLRGIAGRQSGKWKRTER